MSSICTGQLLTEKRHRGQGAMTLVELVVALALGAMLMTGLVGVLGSINRQLRVVQNRTAGHWEMASAEMLHRDLMLSARIAFKDGWLWLEGEFPDYQAPNRRAKRVGYSCVPWLDGESALIRAAGASSDLVAVGPGRLLVERLDRISVPQPLSESSTSIPDRLRVWIWEDDASEPVAVRDLVLR